MSDRYRSRRSRRIPRSARSRPASIECLYCGPSPVLPSGYDGFGSPYRCLRKGIGVGKFGEKRKWQRQLGYRVDPPYDSPCPRVGGVVRSSNPSRSIRDARRTMRRSQRSRSRRPRNRSRSRSNSRSRRRSRSRSRSRSNNFYRSLNNRGRSLSI